MVSNSFGAGVLGSLIILYRNVDQGKYIQRLSDNFFLWLYIENMAGTLYLKMAPPFTQYRMLAGGIVRQKSRFWLWACAKPRPKPH
jgi:hypothetical protein